MKKETKTLIYAITSVILLVCSFAIFGKIAFGAIIPNQGDASALSNTGPTNGTRQFLQGLGTGYTGYVDTLSFSYRRTTSGFLSIVMSPQIVSIDNSNATAMTAYNAQTNPVTVGNYPTLTVEATLSVVDTNTGVHDSGIVTSTTTPILLNPDKTYFLIANTSTGRGDHGLSFYGTPSSWAYGEYIASDTNIGAMYMHWSGFDVDPDASTGIRQIISPSQITPTASTTVNFQYTYYYGLDPRDVEYAGIEIRNLTDQQDLLAPEDIILASGLSTYDNNLTLASGKYYLWRPYLRSEDGIQYVGQWLSLEVLTYSADIELLPTDFNSATSSIASNIANRFLGQQGYLAGKFPFAYFYDVASLLNTLDDTESEVNFPTLTLSTASSSVPLTLVIFSSSTVSQYAGSSNVSIFRTLMGAVLWLAFSSMIFFTIKGIFKH